MLLMGSGNFTRNNEKSRLSLYEVYSKLNGRAFEDFVKRLFQMMKLLYTSSSSRSRITKYKQMISKEIRDREVVLVLSGKFGGQCRLVGNGETFLDETQNRK